MACRAALLPEWLGRVAEHVGQNIADLHLVPIPHHAHVWCVLGADSQPIAVAKQLPAKQANEVYSPTETEAIVLQHVSPPAVKYLTHIEEARILLTAWAGEQTLNSEAQTAPARLPIMGKSLVSAFVKLEQRFTEFRTELLPLAYPMDYPYHLRSVLDAALNMASRTFAVTDSHLEYLEERIVSLPPTLGPLDCNAQNVVISENETQFLDLSRIGWDWPERRLVQYAFALGPYGGRPYSALTHGNVHWYAQQVGPSRSAKPEDIAVAIDAHAFLATLLLIDRARALLQTSGEYPQLAAVWDAPAERFRHLQEILDTPLSEDGLLCQSRRLAASYLRAMN